MTEDYHNGDGIEEQEAAKLQAETDRPVSDTELMLEMATQLLATRPDGSVPGRTPALAPRKPAPLRTGKLETASDNRYLMPSAVGSSSKIPSSRVAATKTVPSLQGTT